MKIIMSTKEAHQLKKIYKQILDENFDTVTDVFKDCNGVKIKKDFTNQSVEIEINKDFVVDYLKSYSKYFVLFKLQFEIIMNTITMMIEDITHIGTQYLTKENPKGSDE